MFPNFEDVSVYEGGKFTLECPVGVSEHYQNITYQWYKNEKPLSSKQNSTLHVKKSAISDAGYYHCKALTAEEIAVSNKALVSVKGNEDM